MYNVYLHALTLINTYTYTNAVDGSAAHSVAPFSCISTCTYTNKHIHIYKRSGWLSGTFCSSIFLFDPEGLIVHYFVNGAGSQHDSALSVNLYALLEQLPEGFCVAADAAFKSSGSLQGKVMKPLRQDQLAKLAGECVTVTQIVAQIKKHRCSLWIPLSRVHPTLVRCLCSISYTCVRPMI